MLISNIYKSIDKLSDIMNPIAGNSDQLMRDNDPLFLWFEEHSTINEYHHIIHLFEDYSPLLGEKQAKKRLKKSGKYLEADLCLWQGSVNKDRLAEVSSFVNNFSRLAIVENGDGEAFLLEEIEHLIKLITQGIFISDITLQEAIEYKIQKQLKPCFYKFELIDLLDIVKNSGND
jgi:predicted DNA-binding protein YlxM (UPF0122 family)